MNFYNNIMYIHVCHGIVPTYSFVDETNVMALLVNGTNTVIRKYNLAAPPINYYAEL